MFSPHLWRIGRRKRSAGGNVRKETVRLSSERNVSMFLQREQSHRRKKVHRCRRISRHLLAVSRIPRVGVGTVGLLHVTMWQMNCICACNSIRSYTVRALTYVGDRMCLIYLVNRNISSTWQIFLIIIKIHQVAL